MNGQTDEGFSHSCTYCHGGTATKIRFTPTTDRTRIRIADLISCGQNSLSEIPRLSRNHYPINSCVCICDAILYSGCHARLIVAYFLVKIIESFLIKFKKALVQYKKGGRPLSEAESSKRADLPVSINFQPRQQGPWVLEALLTVFHLAGLIWATSSAKINTVRNRNMNNSLYKQRYNFHDHGLFLDAYNHNIPIFLKQLLQSWINSGHNFWIENFQTVFHCSPIFNDGK